MVGQCQSTQYRSTLVRGTHASRTSSFLGSTTGINSIYYAYSKIQSGKSARMASGRVHVDVNTTC